MMEFLMADPGGASDADIFQHIDHGVLARKRKRNKDKADCLAFNKQCWKLIETAPALAEEEIAHQLYKDLEKLASTFPDSLMSSLCQALLKTLPPLVPNLTDRQLIIQSLCSGWFHEMCSNFLTDNYSTQLCVMQIVRVCIRSTKSDDDLGGMLELVLEGVVSQQMQIQACTTQCLTLISEIHHIKLPDLFRQYEETLAVCLAKKLLGNTESDNLSILTTCARVFQFELLDTMLQTAMPYILQPLVCNGSEEAIRAISSVASSVNMKASEFLAYFFESLIPIMFITDTGEDGVEKGLRVIEQIICRPRNRIVISDTQLIHNELLLHLHSHPEQVIRGLKFLAQIQTPPVELKNEDDIAEYLQPKFLGFVFFADSKFTQSDLPSKTKRMWLESLSRLIEFMGSRHISSVRTKLLATLKSALQNCSQDLLETCFETWGKFLRVLDVPSLKPILSQIAVILLPFIKTNAVHVVPILEYLIVDHRRSLNDHFSELFFLPDIPALTNVNNVLVNFVNRPDVPQHFAKYLMEAVQFVDVMDRSSVASVPQHFTMTAMPEERLLRIPQIEVKQYALKKLKFLIRNNQALLYKMIMGPDQQTTSRCPQENTLRLMSVLMNGCREAYSPTERQGFAEVLGAIGAVDPDCVETQEFNKKIDPASMQGFLSIRQPDFATSFLKDLVKGYMTSEVRTQDTCGFVIQEALKFYGLRQDNPTREADLSAAIWQNLSADYREVISPFQTSKYRTRPSPIVDQCQSPTFGTRASATYGEWMRNWTLSMLDRLTTNTPTANFMKVCGVLLQHDINRCVTLLPYLVSYLLVHCAEKDCLTDMTMEMLTVLESYKTPQSYDVDLRHLATQIVLSLIDFLKQWSGNEEVVKIVREERLLISPQEATTENCKDLLRNIPMFLESMTDDIVAQACYSCQAYPKALMHYERFLRQTDPRLNTWHGDSSKIQLVQRLYVALEEADGITGLNDIRLSEPSIEDQTVLHICRGNIQEALICYEQAAQKPDSEAGPDQHRNVLRCLLDLDEPNTAMAYCNGILSEKEEWVEELNKYRVEAAWKLGRWLELGVYLNEGLSLPNEFSVGVGRLLHGAKNTNAMDFQSTMANLRSQLMAPVCAASMDKRSYHRSYDHIIQLHILHELEEGAATYFKIPQDEEFRAQTLPKTSKLLLSEWKVRLESTQPSYQNIQKILNVRRIILEAAHSEDKANCWNLSSEIGKCWLESAKLARKSNHLQTAYSFLLNSASFEPRDLAREQAKWLWAKGDRDQAITSLEKATSDPRWLVVANSANKADKILLAKTKLLLARYMEESQSLETTEMCDKFRDVVDLAPKIEKSHFYLGQYHNRVLESMENADKDRTKMHGDQIYLVMSSFMESLKYGCNFIHQSLPRLLSLWLDFGALMAEKWPYKRGNHAVPVEFSNQLTKLQDVMRAALRSVPKYMFLVAFPQLISRICNPNEEVFVLLAEVIAKTTQTFPQQAMWHLAPVSLSRKKSRTARYVRIMDQVKKDQNGGLLKFLTNMEEFCKQCVTLCNLKTTAASHSLSEFGEMKSLRRLLRDTDWLHPILPFRSFMNPVLPSEGCPEHHEPFPGRLAVIQDMSDKFIVLSSLQRPKKMTVEDSTGHSHPIMLKPKDDLRKDSRFMELVEMINKFLREDSESRRRQLQIRAYSVVPLNEDCGIIEWVPNMLPMRLILLKEYKEERNMEVNKDELREYMNQREASMETKLKFFRGLLEKWRPVFHIWMQKMFQDPTAWLAARLSYARTCAVMSIVGYIMGLGDRHGENILVDTTNAEILHVDFSCLFNKGESLDWPERVPFRLTHNIIDGMGPLGVEGFYRTACELTLRVIRERRNPMMSVLKTFLHDPLVEWQQRGNNRANETGESLNEEAKTHVERIRQRVFGQIHGTTESMPLSVQGHVNYLIREASSERNLCQMYVGWSPFM